MSKAAALLYYGPQTGDHSLEIETSINGLLAYGYGRCGAWAQFSKSVFGTQGIVCQLGSFKPKPREYQGDLVTPVAFTVDEQAEGQGRIDPGVYRFPAHQVIRYGNRIYDPSYGVDFDTLNEWEDAMLYQLVLPDETSVSQRLGTEDLEWF